MNYSISSARASLPYSELVRIKIPKPASKDLAMLQKLEEELSEQLTRENEIVREINTFAANSLEVECANPNHYILKRTVNSHPIKPRQT